MARATKILFPGEYLKPSKKAIAIIRERASSNGKRIHVVSSGERWAIKKEGASRAIKVFASKDEALRIAKIIGRNGEANWIISHKEDGTFKRVKIA
jgi:hypothetical protein